MADSQYDETLLNFNLYDIEFQWIYQITILTLSLILIILIPDFFVNCDSWPIIGPEW